MRRRSVSNLHEEESQSIVMFEEFYRMEIHLMHLLDSSLP